MSNMEHNIMYKHFVDNREAIEEGLDIRSEEDKNNVLLLSHLIFMIVDKECGRLGSTPTDHSDEIKNAAASLSYTEILDISIHLVKHYVDYALPKEERVLPKQIDFLEPTMPKREDCTCECHKPGVQIVHCMPCCY